MVPAFVGVSMRLCSCDQSTNRSGVAILEDGVPVFYTVIDHSKEKDVPTRIKNMFLDLVKVIDQNNIDSLVVEAVQFQNNLKAMEMLSQLQGMCIATALLRDIPISSPMPVEWRKVLGFQQGAGVKRPELKAQAIKYVKENFGLDVSEDEAEAICIGRAEYLRLKA